MRAGKANHDTGIAVLGGVVASSALVALLATSSRIARLDDRATLVATALWMVIMSVVSAVALAVWSGPRFVTYNRRPTVAGGVLAVVLVGTHVWAQHGVLLLNATDIHALFAAVASCGLVAITWREGVLASAGLTVALVHRVSRRRRGSRTPLLRGEDFLTHATGIAEVALRIWPHMACLALRFRFDELAEGTTDREPVRLAYEQLLREHVRRGELFGQTERDDTYYLVIAADADAVRGTATRFEALLKNTKIKRARPAAKKSPFLIASVHFKLTMADAVVAPLELRDRLLKNADQTLRIIEISGDEGLVRSFDVKDKFERSIARTSPRN